jgi:predicted RNA polymerase sigma factor
MDQEDLIPHLFRTEYRKIVSVLCGLFGIAHIEIAEDIVSDSFLRASELWGLKGLPEIQPHGFTQLQRTKPGIT